MTINSPQSAPPPEVEHTTVQEVMPLILCVDDEPNILSALRRLLRSQKCRILTASSGAEGLEICETEQVDMVISDMRMPEMDGARFLEKVRERWPQTIRLLLTGHADIQSILDAINRGEIYRYLTKPWDDNDIILTIRHALERQQLERETKRLETLTQQQNEVLKCLNASLEEKVLQRTAELQKAHENLIRFNAKLKANFMTSIKVFSNLLEMRGGNLAGHSLRVADLSRKVAVRMQCDEFQTQDIYIAALLHNIGKIALSDDLLKLSISTMSADQLRQYRKHPLRGEQLLMALDDLRTAATIVRAQQEHFDGSGYPDRIEGEQIALGARILAVTSDYDKLQIGISTPQRMHPAEARAVIIGDRGIRYDPAVVDALMGLFEAPNTVVEAIGGIATVTTAQLQPGMMLARDLITRDGLLLLSAGHVLELRKIGQIIEFENTLTAILSVTVFADGSSLGEHMVPA